jgi:NADPH:quinone reductase-like Zn-dependent oxidoreductase
MEAIRISKYVTSAQQLEVSTVSQPLSSNNTIVVKIDCAAANFFDILQVQGKYQTQPPFPWIAGFEFAGTVVQSFPGAPHAVGDRVFGGSQGAYAEFIALDPKKTPVLPIPEGMSFEEACTLFVTAPTSYLALVHRAQCKAGEIVLVHAGAGGVGLMAVQIAKACGSIVIATASSPEKLQVCREFGADYAINYKSSNWIEEVKRITNGKGCDVIYDPVGMIDSSLKVIGWNGRILVVGFAAGQIEKIAMNKLLLKQCTVMGVYWGGTTVKDPQLVPKVWMGILTMIQEGKLKAPVFSKVYHGLHSVPEALSALGNRETWGKVVIKIAKQSKL